MGIIGGILLVVGIILLVIYFSNKRKFEEMYTVETSTTAALRDVWQGVADEIGAGSFEQKTEINGVIECDQPIESELAKERCVHYRMSVERNWEEDYEEEYTEKDPASGRMVRKTRRGTRKGSDSVANNSRSTKFYVRDETGTILVDPEGANIDVEQVIDRFEPSSSVSRGNISFGGRSFSIGTSRDSGRRRTLGYHFKEWLLPLNRRVYIMGSASDRSGELMIQKPREKGKFLISLKSEEELIASAKSGMTWGLYGAIACFIIGIVLMILQFMR
ncbi:hypothetical protein U27_04324 [Candidatus Vecturithrix granuli]|uniref:RING-type E3 ubiquitin transferase n=1 Tax=Vecturithrix granuli TaxID=1499967 RepID=A0A081BYF4_VECG1|nr:hypothetical protein U27_04324 [Candidatus Vecturithrix granuli]